MTNYKFGEVKLFILSFFLQNPGVYTRRKIFDEVRRREEYHDMKQFQNIVRHLNDLERAGLLKTKDSHKRRIIQRVIDGKKQKLSTYIGERKYGLPDKWRTNANEYLEKIYENIRKKEFITLADETLLKSLECVLIRVYGDDYWKWKDEQPIIPQEIKEETPYSDTNIDNRILNLIQDLVTYVNYVSEIWGAIYYPLGWDKKNESDAAFNKRINKAWQMQQKNHGAYSFDSSIKKAKEILKSKGGSPNKRETLSRVLQLIEKTYNSYSSKPGKYKSEHFEEEMTLRIKKEESEEAKIENRFMLDPIMKPLSILSCREKKKDFEICLVINENGNFSHNIFSTWGKKSKNRKIKRCSSKRPPNNI